MSALSIPVVSTCVYLYLCIFSALQAFIFWFSFSFVHAWSNNFLITLHFVSFHCAFVYQGCVISYCSHCSFHVQPFIPLSLHAHSLVTALAWGCPVSWSCFELQQNCAHTWNVSTCTELRVPVMVSQRPENFPEIQTSLSQQFLIINYVNKKILLVI